MDKNKKLSEELLKIDGIDPTNITDAEREMYKTMLDKEMKYLNKKSWRSFGLVWIMKGLWFLFVLGLIGLALAGQILGKFLIPIIITWIILMIALGIQIFRKQRNFFRQINDSGRKVQKLNLRIYGKHKGLALVGKKNEKRCVNWLNVLIFSLVAWLISFILAIGVYHLLGRFGIGSIQSTIPMKMIIKITILIFIFVALILSQGLKAPLEELTEIKPENYTCSRRKFSFITLAVIIIAVFISIHYSGGSIDPASVAFARATQALKQVSWIHIIDADYQEWTNYDLQIRVKKESDGKVVFDDYKKGREYQYYPETNSINIYSISGSIDEIPIFWRDNLALFEEKVPDGKITSYQGKFEGKDVNIYLLSWITDNNFGCQSELKFDTQTDLLVSAALIEEDGTVLRDIFEYPRQGPFTIYDMGVPKTVKVFDYISGDFSKIAEDSRNKLRMLGVSIMLYGNDNNDMCPDTLQELDGYIDNLQWYLDNIEYIGKGTSLMDMGLPIAYDKTHLLINGRRTYFLFCDGHVEFTNAEIYIK